MKEKQTGELRRGSMRKEISFLIQPLKKLSSSFSHLNDPYLGNKETVRQLTGVPDKLFYSISAQRYTTSPLQNRGRKVKRSWRMEPKSNIGSHNVSTFIIHNTINHTIDGGQTSRIVLTNSAVVFG